MKLTQHSGDTCPTDPECVVMYQLEGEVGTVRIQRAGDLCWGRGEPPEAMGRITGWRVLVAGARTPRDVHGRGRHLAEGTPHLHCETVIVG